MWEVNRNPGAHPAWLLKTTISKFCYSFYTFITLQNLKVFLSVLLLSHSTISKLYQLANLVFLDVGRRYVSMVITVIYNITLLVSHNFICFDTLCPWAMVPIKKLLYLSPVSTPSPIQVLTRFVCCFIRNISTFFCSDFTDYCKI